MDIRVGFQYYYEIGFKKYSLFTIASIKKDVIKIKSEDKSLKGRVPMFKCNFINAIDRKYIKENIEYNRMLKRKDIIDDLL